MPEEGDPELQSMAEILLRRTRKEWAQSSAAVLGECQEDLASGRLSGGQAGRGLLLNAWTQALQRHSDQALTGLVGLLRSYGTPSSAEWIRRRFQAYVDEVSSDLAARLVDTRVAGAATSSSERKRLTNLVAEIKTGADRDLQEAQASLASRGRERRKSVEPPAAELDDRLPLRRRGAFDRDLVQGMEDARTSQEPFSLVMIDLDHFKSVNDEHGHAVGDEVLLAVSRVVAKRVAGKGRAYRYGGEELALLLPNYSEEEALGLAERVRKDVEAAPIGSRRLKVTASLGVACSSGHGADPQALLQRADGALYSAKAQGRNCVRASDG